VTSEGSDIVKGFDDVLGSVQGNDVLIGGPRSDELDPSGGNDIVDGRGGDDFVWGDEHGFAGNDEYRGGAGRDVFDLYYVAASVTVDLAAGTAEGSGSDVTESLEYVIGTGHYPDSIKGSGRAERLVGSGESDVIEGRGGNDVLQGGDLDDRLVGGEGNDVLVGDCLKRIQYDESCRHARGDSLSGGLGDDTIYSDCGDRECLASWGIDEVVGGQGLDLVSYRWAAKPVEVDLSKGQSSFGNDELVDIEGVIGSDYDDVLRGDSEGNVLIGRAGEDVILGHGDDDRLYGLAGDDLLRGHNGDDVIGGGPGRDRARGGDGADECRSSEIVSSCED
jgi:Ca2+-binding RTX toxin-like protein